MNDQEYINYLEEVIQDLEEITELNKQIATTLSNDSKFAQEFIGTALKSALAMAMANNWTRKYLVYSYYFLIFT